MKDVGQIVRFEDSRFGFARVVGKPGRDVYFACRSLLDPADKAKLAVGVTLEFRLQTCDKGPFATDIRVLDLAPIPAPAGPSLDAKITPTVEFRQSTTHPGGMRIGTLTTWRGQLNFGYLRIDGETVDLFVHRGMMAGSPRIGRRYEFEVGFDAHGRRQAVAVVPLPEAA